MQMCQPHWLKCRNAISSRGLDHLIAADGKAAGKRMKAELDGTATPESYDPLMSLHNMIMMRSIELGGMGLMFQKEGCPLCAAEDGGGPGTADKWVEGGSDAVLKHCQENNLVRLA